MHLRARGRDDLAAELGRLFDERLARSRASFSQ